MQFRKLNADKIFNGFGWLREGQVVIATRDGVIADIVPEQEAGDGIEKLSGILTPGHINCHCHLELSHLKNAVPPHNGLVNFLLNVIKSRASTPEQIQAHIIKAENEMAENGTVAVADICNTDHAVEVKQKSGLYFHNLIEVINLHDENLAKQLQYFNLVVDKHRNSDGKNTVSVLTPHAPYSVSKATFEALNAASENAIISIHNQETAAENELFENGRGDFLRLYKELGILNLPIEISNRSSFQTWLPNFTRGQTILIVHNTFISEEDIVFGKTHAQQYGLKLIYCLCPHANLYIENKLPDVEMLIKHDCKIVLGTDSYGSNRQLSIAAEIKTLRSYFPKMELEKMLQWATKNGAEALAQTSLGTIEKGKKPGLVLMETDPGKQEITGISKRIL